MIVGKLQNAADYRGIHPMLDKALDCLNDEFLSTVGTETIHMEGDRLYATLNLFETQPDEKLFFEAHREYLDIHVVLAGEERLDVAYTPDLTLDEAACRPENDFYAYADKTPECQRVLLRQGWFLVAFPSDAHRCKGQVNGASDVRKVVFKIKL
ncbi:MAG: YhcH/YjgK/YiaL family protein [Oscillospiraceae bacterium]|nr:YhcH/YjgK/YiaL family protein [Oscillospiraceae bacterium]